MAKQESEEEMIRKQKEIIGSFIVYYAKQAPVSSFYDADLMIFDNETHPPLRALADRGKTLLGYISIAEIEKTRHYFEEMERAGAIIGPNPNWQDSYYVDIRNKKWIKRLITDLIPDILRQGFHGIFIDTLDDAIELERKDPKKYKNMRTDAINLINGIRKHYPHIKIAINRAYDILDEIGPDIDIVLGESVYTEYNFKTKTYQHVHNELYNHQVDILKMLEKKYPKLQVLTLDYWDKTKPEKIKDIYKKQRANGFTPYVAEILLDSVIKEPKGE